jgi:hypothetical protein
VVYEIRSRLEEMQEPADSTAEPEEAPPPQPPAGQNPQQKKQQEQNQRRQSPSTQGVRQYWLMATQLGGWGAKP